ncbi:MAG: hypothetical protein C5B50_20095 [Verrucomicrobia bacterium]|nr:MAG: hypothetical protein C5B50_20095 [Verrucomicrobiota bacterium]
MKIRKLLLLATTPLLAAILAGCVPMRYTEYSGHDTSSYTGTWPVGPGSMIESDHAVPVYRGWPDKHYQVLGSVVCPDINKYWNDDVVNAAAQEAKKHKADAIIIRQGAEFGVSQIAGTSRNDVSVLASSYQTTALAIRWLTSEEIRQRDLVLDELLKRVCENDSRIAPNRNVAQLVFMYLLGSYDLNSQDLKDKFGETVAKLKPRAEGDLAGDWVFKATISSGTALSGSNERVTLGLATLTTDGNNIAIVSSAGGLELNFNGTLSKGALSGQIGAGSVSGKCDGAATSDKISINFQSLTQDGTVRGNVVLQRLAFSHGNVEIQRVPFNSKNNEKPKPDSVSPGT